MNNVEKSSSARRFNDVLAHVCQQLALAHSAELVALETRLGGVGERESQCGGHASTTTREENSAGTTCALSNLAVADNSTSKVVPCDGFVVLPSDKCEDVDQPSEALGSMYSSHLHVNFPIEAACEEEPGNAEDPIHKASSLHLLKHNKTQVLTSNNAMVEEALARVMCYQKDSGRIWAKENLLTAVELLASVLILINSIIIGLSTDINPGWLGWLVIDSFFAFCFVLELLIKVCLVGIKPYFTSSGAAWNYFDGLLTMSAVVEVVTSLLALQNESDGESESVNMSFFRVMRLVRIVKITRLARVPFLTELMMMLQGALGGAKTFMWSLVLISVPIYMVALVLRETLGSSAEHGKGAEEFSNIGKAFFTVFRCCVAQDCTQKDGQPLAILVTRSYGWFYGLAYIFTIALFTFGIFNVFTAIYVENIVDAAKRNEALHKARRMADSDHLTQLIQEMMLIIWQIRFGSTSLADGMSATDALQETTKLEIDASFFQELCDNQQFQEILNHLEIATEDRVDLFDTLDVGGHGKLDLRDMVMGIAKLRGQPRRSDIVGAAMVARNLQKEQRKLLAAITDKLRLQTDVLRKLSKSESAIIGNLKFHSDALQKLSASDAHHQPMVNESNGLSNPLLDGIRRL